MVEVVNATVPSGKSPPRQSVSWGAIVCVQILSLVLGGVVLDDGFIGTVLLGGTVLSWVCGIAFALRRRSQSVSRVLAWSWLAGVAISATIWIAGGFGFNHAMARRALIGRNEQQITIACMSYCAEDPKGSWPLDMPSLIAWSKGDLDDRYLKVRWHPELEHPILYVRPVPKVSSRQPVLISDPACDRKGRSMVCYGDGHIGAIADAEKARAVWVEAKRLAALPKAQAEGISKTDWTVGIEDPSP